MALSQTKLSLLTRLIGQKTIARIARALDKLHPAELMTLYESLDPLRRETLIKALPRSRRIGDFIRDLPEHFIEASIGRLDMPSVSRLVGALKYDDAVRLLEILGEDKAADIIKALPADQRTLLEDYVLYPEGSAGRNMEKGYFTIVDTMTVAEATARIKEVGKGGASMLYVYVDDEEGRLVGVLSLRSLILEPNEKMLRDIMETDVVSVHATTSMEEVAHLADESGILAVPVVDSSRRTLGVVAVDELLEVLQHQATEDMHRMAGTSTDDRIFSPVTRSYRHRIPWMMLNSLTALMSAYVIGIFEDVIAQVVALASLMHITAAMGGNAGTQCLTVTTRGIALGELEFTSGLKVLLKEIRVGLLIGSTMGLIVGVLSYLWRGDIMLGVVLFAAMCTNMMLAGLAGAGIPMLLRRLGKDPALGGGVVLTAITDVSGLAIFLGLASALL